MVQMTKRALASSFKHVLQSKPVSKITVNDITEDCGINRSTFYYHFRDIYDLMEWMVADAMDLLLEVKLRDKTWQEGLEILFQDLLENRVLLINLYRHVDRACIERYVDQALAAFVGALVEEQSRGLALREEERTFAVNFYKYALGGVILHWIDRSMEDDPGWLVRCVSAVVPADIPQALRRLRLD